MKVELNRERRKIVASIFADVARRSKMELYILVLAAPLIIIGLIFAIVFAIQDRKQAGQE